VCVDWLHWGKVLCVRWFCVCGLVVLKLGTVCWVMFCVWIVVLGLGTVFCVLLSVLIGCTEFRYCAFCGVVCVDRLHWGKVLCVRWFCVCGLVVLKLGTVCWVVCEWMR